MISGWTAPLRDSSKTEGGKIRPACFASLCLRAIVSRVNVLPDIILSFSRKVVAGTKDSAGGIGPDRWPAAAECLTR